MPMSFPTMESLTSRARQRGFRQPHEGEGEAEYRAAFAEFMRGVDQVEAAEIAVGVPFDRQDPHTLLSNALGPETLATMLDDLFGPDLPLLEDSSALSGEQVKAMRKEDPGQYEVLVIDSFRAELAMLVASHLRMLPESDYARGLEMLANVSVYGCDHEQWLDKPVAHVVPEALPREVIRCYLGNGFSENRAREIQSMWVSLYDGFLSYKRHLPVHAVSKADSSPVTAEAESRGDKWVHEEGEGAGPLPWEHKCQK